MSARSAMTDAVYVALGFGVLGFQKIQVRRQEVTKELKKLVGSIGAQLPRS